MLHRSFGDYIVESCNIIILLIIAGAMFFPFVYIISVSFSTLDDYMYSSFMINPRHWVVDAYQYILQNNRFIHSMLLTIYITVIGTFMNLAFTSTMAYGLSKNFYGQKPIIFMVLLTFLFSAGIIPTYLIVKATGLLDSVWSLIIPVLISPWNLIVFREFYKSIPGELNEAAHIDGANEFKIFMRIMLPLSKPALAAFGLFYAVSIWNNYFTGMLYLNDSTKWPIQVLLRQIVVVEDMSSTLMSSQSEKLNIPQPPAESIQMAAILLATAPILIVYPFLQKYFAKGVMLGSVKG